MKSTPGSDRATPLHGQVKFVPSNRNWFSFVPEPNAETVVAVPLDGDVGETPGAALIEVEHARPPRRESRGGLGAEAGSESAVPCFDAGSPALDHERNGGARRLQDKGSLDGGAYRDADIVFVRGCEPLKLDLQHVGAWRESRKAKLASVVGGLCRRSTNQRRGPDAHDRPLEDTTTPVLHGADERARQALRAGSRRKQDESRGSQQELSPSPSSRRSAVSGERHVTLPSRIGTGDGQGIESLRRSRS